MKVSINIPGAGQVYVSGAAEVVNVKHCVESWGSVISPYAV